MSEEMERRVAQLEDRVEALEKAFNAVLAHPAPGAVTFQISPLLPPPLKSDGSLDINAMVTPLCWSGLSGWC